MEAPVSRAMVSAAFCGYCGSTNSVRIPSVVTKSQVSAMSRVLGSSPGFVGDHAGHMQAIRIGKIGERLVERDDVRARKRRKLLSSARRQAPSGARCSLGILLYASACSGSASASPSAMFCTCIIARVGSSQTCALYSFVVRRRARAHHGRVRSSLGNISMPSLASITGRSARRVITLSMNCSIPPPLMTSASAPSSVTMSRV